MGIVNINDDSFSGDGTLDVDHALAIAKQMVNDGADVIDIGAESARTNRVAISEDEEIRRFSSWIERWHEVVEGTQARDGAQVWPPILSVNTWRPGVVEALLKFEQVELVNDMGGLPDARNARSCAEKGVALLIMHSVGEPKVAHFHQTWQDLLLEMETFFEQKIALAVGVGLSRDQLLLDPGVDFAKQKDDNLRVYRDIARFQQFGIPLMIPVSRKTVIGEVLNLPEPRDRDAGTIACMVACMKQGGAMMFRVHHVDAAWQSVKVVQGLLDGEGREGCKPD